VISEAWKQLALWRKIGLNIEVSVNISALHLQWQGFFNKIDTTLAEHPDIPSKLLQLEILESSVLSDVTQISNIIRLCRHTLGVKVALDDFGTGYSSLTHLRRIAVDTIKIDQSFVRDMLADPDDYARVKAVIGLAKAFRREVVAEGVETNEHRRMLIEIGCIHAQGYGIARPMVADNLPKWTDEYSLIHAELQHIESTIVTDSTPLSNIDG
jgi:EAL domain-containing protein (putative c-di-GMP-specific phosphodiesterase class I)